MPNARPLTDALYGLKSHVHRVPASLSIVTEPPAAGVPLPPLLFWLPPHAPTTRASIASNPIPNCRRPVIPLPPQSIGSFLAGCSLPAPPRRLLHVARRHARDNTLSRDLQRGRHRAPQHHVLAERGDGDLGPERHELAQLSLDRFQQQVAVATDS